MREQCVSPLTQHTLCKGGEESEECVFLTLIAFVVLPLKDTSVRYERCIESTSVWAERRARVGICVSVGRQGRCIHCKLSKHHTVKLGVIQVEDTT